MNHQGVCLSRVFLTSLCCLWLIVGCHSNGQNDDSAEELNQLSLWAHAGQAGERDTLQKQVEQFNRDNPSLHLNVTFIPERTYNAQVQAAAVSGELPDILEIDGPYLANYAWQGRLRDLTPLIQAELLSDLLPSIRQQGSYRNTLYGIGTFDSGLGLYARRSLLTKIGITLIPNHPKQAWTVEQFEDILARLNKQDKDGAILDLKLNYPDEWFSYAFSPFLQSAGADLINRSNFQSADTWLNSPAAIDTLQHVQSWIQKKWVDPNLDDAAFTSGRVALSLTGHWEYQRYHTKWGDDLILLPLPNFGKGSKSGQGSWLWSISQKSEKPELAAGFINFLLQTPQVLAMCRANGAVPATKTAIAKSALYRADAPLHLFAVQLSEGYTIPRPPTPAYPVISASFRRAFADIRNGGNVKAALDHAVKGIDRDIRDNKGYPPHE